MQLFKIITRHSPGEGDDYTEIRTNGKRCVVIEKTIGVGAKTNDIDANGAGYLIRRMLDERQALSQRELATNHIDGVFGEPDIHAQLSAIMRDNPRSIHSPLLARWVWGQCHQIPLSEAA